jgi:hypothetical protein
VRGGARLPSIFGAKWHPACQAIFRADGKGFRR